jgi:hypothetical protein
VLRADDTVAAMNESAALATAPSRPWLSSAGPAFAQPSGAFGSTYGSGYGAGGPPHQLVCEYQLKDHSGLPGSGNKG